MIYLKNGQPSCHQRGEKILEHTLIGSPGGWSESRSQPATGSGGKLGCRQLQICKNRNYVQTISLVKEICVLIHITLGNHCLSLFSMFIVVTHLDRNSAMGLFLPGTWITMIFILKMTVISQKFLAQVAKKGSQKI